MELPHWALDVCMSPSWPIDHILLQEPHQRLARQAERQKAIAKVTATGLHVPSNYPASPNPPKIKREGLGYSIAGLAR
ncbi:hypothetical protein CDAR_500821 [Caerostris darwini]|uniref:Uncharacterized protein n=1 Tax=Caerostris darwini TaxID=1538125 RepID=A0AAV4NMC7_9ARAC|nr:hypothetical protein CDAR_500821 [Caerostris darwini]